MIRGEKTPYSYRSGVEEQIYKYNPEIKLIWIFRNPADRAFSNYNHLVNNVDEWRSFEKSIEIEQNRPYHFQYLDKGKYIDQIERFLKYFKREQMHFIIFEEFLKNTREELNSLCSFLGVDKNNFTSFEKIQSKISFKPRFNPLFLYSYKKKFGDKGRLWNLLWKINFNSKGVKQMNPETRAKLIKYYSAYNHKLSDFLQKDLSVWNK